MIPQVDGTTNNKAMGSVDKGAANGGKATKKATGAAPMTQVAVSMGVETRGFLDGSAGKSFSELETGIRAAALRDAAQALADVYDAMVFDAPVCPACGGRMHSRGRVEEHVLTMTGPMTVHPARYVCPGCGSSSKPLLDMLGLVPDGDGGTIG
jgi:hypothetical protein